MRTLLRTIASAAVLAAVVAVSPVAAATTIDTTGLWNNTSIVGALGSPSTGVIGQTFTAPTNQIDSFTFFVNDRGSMINVVAAIYTWSGDLIAGNFPQGATGSALFSSGVIETPGVDGLVAMTILTAGTGLVTGQNYVALFAATTPNQGEAVFGIIDPNPGVANDGGFNYFNNNFDLDMVNNGNWNGFLDFGTLAWVGDFGGSVPEPETWALMLIGFGALGATMRRQRGVVAA